VTTSLIPGCCQSSWQSNRASDLRGSLVYSGHTSSSQAYKISSYMSVAPGATCRKNDTLTGSPILTRWPFCTNIWRVYLHRSLPSRDGTRYCSGWWPSLKGCRVAIR
jgi:hypothetical protein